MSQAGFQVTTLTADTAMPRPALSPVDGVAMADSRNVAIMFGKRHDNVLRDIRGLLNFEDTPCARHFKASTHVDPRNGQTYPHYLMDRDGFSLLAMGFTGARATRWKLDFIEAFSAMEAELRRRATPAIDLDDNDTLRRLLLGRVERVAALEAQVEETTHALAIAHEVIEQDSPKIAAYETLMDDKGTCCLADAARHIGASQEAFFRWIRASGFVFEKAGETLPVAEYRIDGQFKVKLTKLSRNRYASQTRVTRQGLAWLTQRWQAHLLKQAREADKARIQGELGI